MIDPDETLRSLDFEYPMAFDAEGQADWDALKEYYAHDPEKLVQMELARVKATEIVRAALEGRDPRTAWPE